MRIFVSSPGDVGEERALAELVIKRLQNEFAGRVVLDPYFWEHQPLRATASFQDQILRPSQTDIVILILWSRLGTRVPAHLCRPDGSTYASGTEYEFEDAINGYLQTGMPDLLVYRKTATAVAELSSEQQVLEKLAQKKAVDAFIDKWFQDAQGSFIAAFHNFETPAKFEELLETHLRKLIQPRIPQQPVTSQVPEEPPAWREGSPYRGLQVFDFQHAPIFFGRTQAVSDILGALRKQADRGCAFLMVLGMSGCGKSSLIRAGVLPRLTQPGVIEGIGLWRRATLRPGDSPIGPLEGLSLALLRDDAIPELGVDGPEELAQLLRESPKAIGPLIKAALAHVSREVQRQENLPLEPATRLVVLVDQLEEIFTQERTTHSQREEFTAAAAALAHSGCVWVIATLRSDFYARCCELPALHALKEGDGQYDLMPPTPAEIALMIRQPTHMAGLVFEEHPETKERLDEVLRDAAISNPKALPLLEFTLEELYKHRTEQNVLSHQVYQALGGMQGALARRAEEVFSALAPAVREALPMVLSGLLGLGQGQKDSPTSRRVPLGMAASTPESRALVDAFVAARMFVVDRADDGSTVVSVAHEALLDHWQRVQDWLAQNRDFLRLRAKIATATSLWQEGAQTAGFLLPEDSSLTEAAKLMAKQPEVLSDAELHYIRASLHRAASGRRRRAAMRISVAALLAVAVGLGIWTWDAYFRTHVRYYMNFAKRWGDFEGIGQVSEQEVRHRTFTFQFMRRGRRSNIAEVRVVNSSGGYASYHTAGTYLGDTISRNYSTLRECRIVLERDSDGHVIKEKAFDKVGRAVYELVYISENTASYIQHGRLCTRSRSGAAYVQFNRSKTGSDAGLDKEIRYYDLEYKPQPDDFGSYGERLEYNTMALPGKVTNLGSNGNPTMLKTGFASVTLSYDSNGNRTRAAFRDLDGRPAFHTDGYAAFTLKYDNYGNQTEAASLDPDGRLRRQKDGYARFVMQYDNRGNVIEQVFYDENGKPTLHKEGFVRFTARHDPATGNRTAQTFYDETGKPAPSREGFAEVAMKYDDDGNLIEQAHFDENHKPTRHKEGYARWTAQYDEWGNQTQMLYLDEDGKPVRHRDGYVKWTAEYDTLNRNQVARAFYDANDKPTRSRDGYARVTMDYDNHNNVVAQHYFDENGEPTRHKEGYAGWAARYDEQGNQVEMVYLDENGKPTRNRHGYAKWTAQFDSRTGNRIAQAFHDENGAPTPNGDGFARAAAVYDERGNIIEQTYFNEGGKPARHKDGNGGWTAKYDPWDNQTEFTYIDENRNAMRCAMGYAGWTARYDRRGNQTQQIYFDENGKPVETLYGYAEIRRTYDRRCNILEQAYFDKNGRPVRHADGNAGWTAKYDQWGNQVEMAFFDENTRPVRHREGYARLRARYDPWGNCTEESYYNEFDQPVARSSGFAQVRMNYDDRGNMTGQAFFDEKGHPVLNQEGVARWAATYDSGGNRTEMVFFDEKDRRTRNVDGLGRITMEYDTRGYLIEQAYYDETDVPVPDRDGIARYCRKYDTGGHLLEETYFDAVGNAALCGSGYARVTYDYSDAGVLIDAAFWDTRGAPAKTILTVAEVLPTGQGHTAGLLPGDIIVSYEGKEVLNSRTFIQRVFTPGSSPRQLIVRRNGKPLTFQVNPGPIGIRLDDRGPGKSVEARHQ